MNCVLEAKVFQPFYISHTTIIHFQKQQKQEEIEFLSIKDTMRLFLDRNKKYLKLYFKVNSTGEATKKEKSVQDSNRN